MKMLLKIEAGVATHIALSEGGWGVYTTGKLRSISVDDKEFIMGKLTSLREPRIMSGAAGDSLSCPHFMHCVAGLSNDKPNAIFSIKYVQVDLVDQSMYVLEEWDVAVQQWEDMDRDSGFVHIDETIHY